MRCWDCYGTGKITCPVCKGSTKDPRNTAKDCSYCGGEGKVKCDLCLGKGTVPDDFKNLWCEKMEKCWICKDDCIAKHCRCNGYWNV